MAGTKKPYKVQKSTIRGEVRWCVVPNRGTFTLTKAQIMTGAGKCFKNRADAMAHKKKMNGD